MVKLLYVAGYARSGSTFFDSVLGSHPRVFSAGELTHLYDDAHSGAPCGCGEPLTSCEIWGKVLSEVAADPNDARILTRRCEHGLRGRRVERQRLRDYEDLWRSVLASLERHADADVIVDASKTMLFAAKRPWLMRGLDRQHFRLVHLTRDPRASAWSVRKGGNPIAANRRLKSLSAWRTAGTWIAANIVAERAASRSVALHVRYEDLVQDPGHVLNRVGELVDLDLETVADHLAAGRALPAGHGISGNRVRHSGTLSLNPDEDWRSSAPASIRRVMAMTAPLAHRYGYRVTSKDARRP